MPEQERNIDALVVPRTGRVEEVPGGLVPYRLVDASGTEMAAVSEFLRNLTASDCSPGTVRSYAFELLGWIRFLRRGGGPVGPGVASRGPRLRALAGADAEAAATASR